MVPSNILIWEPDFGFFKINEGNGSNLLEEDEAAGYVDYIMYEAMEYNGYDFTEIDGVKLCWTNCIRRNLKMRQMLFNISLIPTLFQMQSMRTCMQNKSLKVKGGCSRFHVPVKEKYRIYIHTAAKIKI